MSNFNYVKRIDDLGRIVIPKEIRRILKIEENESMEISIVNDNILIKKHSVIEEKIKDINNYGNILTKISSKDIIITNREKIIFSTISNIKNKEISDEFKECIIKRKEIKREKNIEIVKNIDLNNSFIYKIVIIDSDATGLIILTGEKIEEKDKILLDLVVKLIESL